MNEHSKSEYHHNSTVKAAEFLARYTNPSKAIDLQVERVSPVQQEENRAVIESLIKVALLCGKQGVSLSGHRDDHVFTERDGDWLGDGQGNVGNFIELVRFRAETDQILAKHLKHSPKNALYTSKTVQNELIDAIASYMRTQILEEVKDAKLFSVIADEVADISNKDTAICHASLCCGESGKGDIY